MPDFVEQLHQMILYLWLSGAALTTQVMDSKESIVLWGCLWDIGFDDNYDDGDDYDDYHDDND